MKELKIDPKFRDLIPPLTEAEQHQLEENILDAGQIYEPIVTWNGTIIDGHHRYEIALKYPDIKWDTRELPFSNEYAAMAWACNNQLGRRNLTDAQKTYLIGKRLDNEKAAYGAQDGFRGNRYKKGEDLVRYQNGNLLEPEPPRGRTAERLAKEYGVGQGTVNRAADFAKGVDVADEIEPGIKDSILSGQIKVPKSTIQQISRVEPEQQEQAVKFIMDGKMDSARKVLNSEPIAISEEPYNADDLLEDIRANWQNCKRSLLEAVIDTHIDLLETEEGNRNAQIGFDEIISDVEGLLKKIKIIQGGG